MADVTARQSTPAFLFLYPKSVTARDAISITATPTSAQLAIAAADAFVYREIHVTTAIDASGILRLSPFSAEVSVAYVDVISVPRRTNRISFQARLGSRLDPIKRKLLDNNILLSANPTDMLRVRVERDSRTQDILSRKIVANEILPIMLPTMKDVPMRRMVRDDKNVVSFSMADVDNSKPFEAFCPMHGKLRRDDLLFRFIKDPDSELPYAMVLQVKDELGTLAYSSLLYIKYSLTFYDESIPSEIVNAVYQASLKRERLGW